MLYHWLDNRSDTDTERRRTHLAAVQADEHPQRVVRSMADLEEVRGVVAHPVLDDTAARVLEDVYVCVYMCVCVCCVKAMHLC